jgi:hypothetical protein
VSTNAQCLKNVPNTVDTYINNQYEGQIWDFDDQCKQIHGDASIFCRVI